MVQAHGDPEVFAASLAQGLVLLQPLHAEEHAAEGHLVQRVDHVEQVRLPAGRGVALLRGEVLLVVVHELEAIVVQELGQHHEVVQLHLRGDAIFVAAEIFIHAADE